MKLSHFFQSAFNPEIYYIILLFRDDTPHVPNEDLGEEAVLDIISNLTHLINQVFPSKCEVKRHHVYLRSTLTVLITHIID